MPSYLVETHLEGRAFQASAIIRADDPQAAVEPGLKEGLVLLGMEDTGSGRPGRSLIRRLRKRVWCVIVKSFPKGTVELRTSPSTD